MSKYTPSPKDLVKKASLYWPKELRDKEEATSVLPLLISTQDKFISILEVSDKSPNSWKSVLRATKDVPPNLFLKHLMVLSDVGGEPLKRLGGKLSARFPSGEMVFVWQKKKYTYKFQKVLAMRSLDNKVLFVDGKSLATGHDLSAAMEDVIMLILFGGAALNAPLPDMVAEKCTIGTLIGRKAELQKFVRQRYIFVSRIMAGATSNSLGQIAQSHVRDTLQAALTDWTISRNGKIPGISQNTGNTDMTFDLVAKSPSNKYFAIEVSYQVTTNSVIERKAGQAHARAELLHDAGHQIAYVLDGAGNFEREAALRAICRASDCTVAFTPPQLNVLIEFLKNNA